MDGEEEDCSCSKPSSPPHEALFLVLPYLPVCELLAISQVCLSLRDAVNKDVLPWLNLLVQSPLSSHLSDDVLFKLSSRANGGLKTLALMNCSKVTDSGLLRVVQENPFLNKLYIPSCTNITPEGVLRAVKLLSQGSPSLSTIRINGIHNLNKQHLDTLTSYLKSNHQPLQQPMYYHRRSNMSAFKHGEDETPARTIDLEMCPKCLEPRMVYDCPRETCKMKKKKKKGETEMGEEWCRACHFCIPRCEDCGICVGYGEMEESACEDSLCGECWLKLPKCNFCNKPYCKQHTDWWCRFSESRFICRVCNEEYLGYMPSNDVF
ncbi:F-box protein SKIP28 [Senna tora]|uniref:F-box protein SKIP28 n=1 Tax=Senna tora TaxID=362788 RepID=A0A834W4V7_9FABA|nr:F-box protein SKIP28 [Senna tora]